MVQCLCPSCGGQVKFQSSVSVFAVCSYCTATLVRRDLDVEMLGKMALLPEDSSPLQIGSQGKFEGVHFQLIGRVRQGWSDGNWNEWFALFDDARRGWLAEAQGFYAMNFEKAVAKGIPDQSQVIAGKELDIDNIHYQIDDIKEVTCVGSQGELPFRAVKGRKATSVDLADDNNHFGCIEYSEEGIRFFEGKYCDFEQFQFKNLRQIDGW